MTSHVHYQRGSEWRKWDLHIHSPGTKKNDGFRPAAPSMWDQYCQKLESSDVNVFGITDYFSADGYFNTVREFQARHPQSTKVLFPNIELSTNEVINKQREEVNLHIIFNPGCADKCALFLSYLQLTTTDAKERNLTAAELTSQDDYDRAMTSRQFIRDALVRTFGPKADLIEHVLIFAAINNDGIRPERGAKRKAALSDEYDKFCHGFFGNSQNTEFFLDSERLESGDEIEPKPVVAGSDAHSLKDLDEWLGKMVPRAGAIFKQCTWIKADPTFEGLKQIIFEPRGRVLIGEEPEIESKVRSSPRRYLKELRIDRASGYAGRFGAWFSKERIEFNKELVAVIGNKGSGKSALTDWSCPVSVDG
jgi:hypothetical protein